MSQSLPDGNRITRKTTAAVSRDSEGRTRRETNLAALGPLAPHEAPRLVFIQASRWPAWRPPAPAPR